MSFKFFNGFVLIQLQVENRRLQQELRLRKVKSANNKAPLTASQGSAGNVSKDRNGKTLLDDDRFLESIEASFKQFYQFLDLLKGKGKLYFDHAMRKALSDGKEDELGFTITPRRSRRYPKVVLADLDFADDIALLSDAIIQAQELLLRVETEYSKVGLGLNDPKTKYLAYNIDVHTPLVTRSGTVLEQKDDLKYLGSWVDKSIKDVNIRKALAWKALNDMSNIWKSTMNPVLKKRFFVATVESILLYGCESWTMTETMVKSLSGAYTRILRKALNVHWSSCELQVENRRLQQELRLLKVKSANNKAPLTASQGSAGNVSKDRNGKTLLDDDRFLESIEASFKQFYQFLDLLKGKGYGDLVRALQENGFPVSPEQFIQQKD
ncbi:hypothetical protein AC249_AIPGENE19925 [Exaiptasia diaphana]|nr:hypothetical protein AC249_AIPGENE19925 [Exaiptasia diaphana]